MQTLKFESLPQFPGLYVDYINNFENLSDFYEYDFKSNESFRKRIDYLQNFSNDLREKIANILSKQYENFSPSVKTLANIDKLKKNNSFAIITGQQISVAGGPLYSILKTITALKLSFLLKEKFFSYNFIPIFWMPTDDSDFDEINSLALINKENKPVKILFDKSERIDKKTIVGRINIEESHQIFFDELPEHLRSSEFTEELILNLKKYYTPGKTLKTAFKEFLMSLFDEEGLIIFDPDDPEAKKTLVPIFEREIHNYADHSRLLIQDSAILEENYHAQVKIKPINLFLLEGNERFLIEPDKNNFFIRGKKTSYSKNNLLEILQAEPQRFIPNVLLRPICQDFLFPTLCYVAGPSEIAYFAQIKNYYKVFGAQMPIIYPRVSATILEPAAKKILDKYKISLSDFFANKNECFKNLLNSQFEINPETIFRSATSSLDLILSDLKSNTLKIDPTLQNAFDNLAEKINQSIESYKRKVELAFQNKNSIIMSQFEKLSNLIYPFDNLQEREINLLYFQNKYGANFHKILYDSISINIFEHQIVEL